MRRRLWLFAGLVLVVTLPGSAADREVEGAHSAVLFSDETGTGILKQPQTEAPKSPDLAVACLQSGGRGERYSRGACVSSTSDDCGLES